MSNEKAASKLPRDGFDQVLCCGRGLMLAHRDTPPRNAKLEHFPDVPYQNASTPNSQSLYRGCGYRQCYNECMKKNKQLVVDAIHGDCMRACFTSILGIPNDPKLAVGSDPEWFLKWHKFLYRFGVTLTYSQKACWKHGYWVASVKSLNYPDKATHAIVMKGSAVYFDPSTAKKRYKSGESLLGRDVVLGGHFFEISDGSKLRKLIEYQNAFAS